MQTLELCLPAPSTSAVLWIGYLRSYEHMGRARATCSGRCGCEPHVFDAHDFKSSVSVTDVRSIVTHGVRAEAPTGPSSGTQCCLLQLQVTQGSSSGEHKFKLMSILQGGADARGLQARASVHKPLPDV